MKRVLVALLSSVVVVAVAVVLASAAPEPGGRRNINLPERTDDRPFSNAVLVGDTLYLSGALGIDPETNAVPKDVEKEIRIILDGMKRRLEMVDMTMDDLVTVQVFCPDLSLYGQFNDVYRTYFKDGFPARAFIGSGPLLRGAHFEIMGTAVKQ